MPRRAPMPPPPSPVPMVSPHMGRRSELPRTSSGLSRPAATGTPKPFKPSAAQWLGHVAIRSPRSPPRRRALSAARRKMNFARMGVEKIQRLPRRILEALDWSISTSAALRVWSISARSGVHTSTPCQTSRGRVFAGARSSINDGTPRSPMPKICGGFPSVPCFSGCLTKGGQPTSSEGDRSFSAEFARISARIS
jgi:hypothetical protein